MPSIPFELFFQYIQDNRFINLIRIVNQYLNIHIVTSKLSPASAGGSTAEEGITGHFNNQLDEFHQATSVTLENQVFQKYNYNKIVFFISFFFVDRIQTTMKR